MRKNSHHLGLSRLLHQGVIQHDALVVAKAIYRQGPTSGNIRPCMLCQQHSQPQCSAEERMPGHSSLREAHAAALNLLLLGRCASATSREACKCCCTGFRSNHYCKHPIWQDRSEHRNAVAKHTLTHVGIAVGTPCGPINDVQLLQREAQGACQGLNLLPACGGFKLQHARHCKKGTTMEAGQLGQLGQGRHSAADAYEREIGNTGPQ